MSEMEGISLTIPAKPSRNTDIQTCTIRDPEYAYVHLELLSSAAAGASASASTDTTPAALDALHVRSMLSHALSRFLGAAGNAVSPDVLRVDAAQAWVRVPRGDLPALTAALAFWSGEREGAADVTLRVRQAGNWLGCLAGKNGQDGLWG